MIVDDESLALSRLKRLLNENGIEDITAFDNPIDALKEITKTKFDVVFLDISMPNITGLELADSIIQLEPKTFIIFQTAYSEFALEAYKSGGMGYLVKPIESNDIKNILEKIRNFKRFCSYDTNAKYLNLVLEYGLYPYFHQYLLMNIQVKIQLGVSRMIVIFNIVSIL